jgi:translation initiation factor IF-2
MPKKVFELAKELDMGAIDLVEKLKGMGMSVRNHMVTLDDDQVKEALTAFAPKEAATKKKVTKKKTAKKKTAKKKVTKKKVVKKVAKKASSSDEETVEAKPAEEVDTTEKATKTVVVKKKTVAKKKAAKKIAAQAKEQARIAEKEKSKEDGEDLYKEQLHTFTPVYIPDEKEQQENREKREKEEAKSRKPDYSDYSDPTLDADGKAKKIAEEGKNKKRMGELAAAVSKKAKPKDLTEIRANEEMKLATVVVGNQIYTPIKKKKIYVGETKQTEITEVKDSKRVVDMHGAIKAGDLAAKLSQKFKKFANKALELNLLVGQEDYLGVGLATELAALYNYRVEDKKFDEAEVFRKKEDDKSKYPLRNPIITVMGHVDHGKTTLLDNIRKASVVDGEAGGITQHIGSYSVKVGKATITFLDTPGHAAFASMRQRGANVTDIVVLVVAADDGVMPQTVESIKFAKNADCPIIVAVNKMDKEGANPDRIKQQLMEFELTPEEWGGDTMFVPVSALNGDGMDDLLENIKLQAEVMELRENPKGKAEGVIIESKVEKGRGPVATVLVQKGTLKKGDAILAGEQFGRARSLMDDSGKTVQEAGPSIPVQILGLNDVPVPGEILNVVKNERDAKKIVDNRVAERKKLENVEAPKVQSLEDFFASAPTDVSDKKVLKLIVRADVQGSFEAIKEALETLGNDEVGVEVISGGVGAISDNDVMMAAEANGYIMGFNMRPVTSARRIAEEKGVEIKTYSIIYELINDITLALEGMLTPEAIEKYIGRAEVRDTFSIPKVGMIAGTAVIDGKIERGCNIRLLREGKIIYDGKLSTLKRFKDEVKEVKNGYECGMALENFNDIKVDDLIEAYIMEEKQRKLEQNEATL